MLKGIVGEWRAYEGSLKNAAREKIEQLTLYCLSSENWRRPAMELDFLMHLLEQYMIEERELIMEQRICVSRIGRRNDIPASTLQEVDRTIELSKKNNGLRLCLAINYGGRRADRCREKNRWQSQTG